LDTAGNILRKFGKLLRILPRKSALYALRKYRVAAATEHDAVLSSRKFALIIDVGANRGQFSLAARHFQPDAHIVAFEPLADAASVYRKLFDGDRRVRLHQCAIGPVQSQAAMYVSGRDDASSLLPVGDLMLELYRRTGTERMEEVRVVPFTDFLSSNAITYPALLKIDVQGYELEVLKSAEPVLPHLDCIYVEASFVAHYHGQALVSEIISYLHQHRFRLSGMYNLTHDPRTGAALQADFLFERGQAGAPSS
jgi:FkbM family methyltransferase